MTGTANQEDGMSENPVAGSESPESGIEPLFHPCASLDPAAPLRWLALGWADLKRARRQSLAYGLGIVGIVYLVFGLAWDDGHTVELFTVAVALVLASPVLAFGLYSISRQLELGREPRLGVCWMESRNHLRNELLFALVILVVLLIWARAASMVHVFFPVGEDIGLVGWLQFLGVGSVVGGLFATIVFAASVVSLPLMLDRDTDAITGVLSSVNAVLSTKLTMLVWAFLIFGLIAVGLATAGLGLAIVLPLVGHATWHAYRETIPVVSPLADDAPAKAG
jgi:uncharacterized membrane protein